MLERIEFKIGDVEPTLGEFEGQKFIVSKAKDSIAYHARVLTKPETYHREIAKMVGVDEKDVVGGGRATIMGCRAESNNILQIYGNSEFGKVPEGIMERFNLLPVYHAIDPTITKLIIEIDCRSTPEEWIKYCKLEF